MYRCNSISDRILVFIIMQSIVNAAGHLLIGIMSGLDSRLYLHKMVVILAGMTLFLILGKADCMSFIRRYKAELIILMVAFAVAYVILGEKSGGTLWLSIGRYMSLPVETMLYLFVPLVMLLLNTRRQEQTETRVYKGTIALYTILMIIYLGVFIWMTLSGYSDRVGMFGRASALLGIYVGAAMLMSPSASEESK
ncbi:MAG: hypothetical protein K5888_10585 [Lachnospiraceae bacterium]|nr:hypothetical protein [Lachnospiraceae bacterium]